MTNLTNTPKSGLHYRLTPEEWDKAWQELKPSEIRILYHLRLMDPFGDRHLEIGVRELARTLNIDHATVSRALKTLDAKGYIDLELLQVKARIHSKGEVVSPDTTGDSTHQRRSPDTTDDRETPPPVPTAAPENLLEAVPEAFSPEGSVVPEQSLKDIVNNRFGLPTEETNQRDVGTLPQRLVEEAGIPLNAALLSVIKKLEQTHPEEVYSRVTNAISAYLEQKATVRNPQAFLSAALRRGFTSNSAKKENRQKTEKSKKSIFPPAPAMPQILDLSDLIVDIQIHCQRLGITVKEAIERFGRVGRSLGELTNVDLATLRFEIASW